MTSCLKNQTCCKIRIAEKELETAKASSKCGSSFRCIPVVLPDDRLTKHKSHHGWTKHKSHHGWTKQAVENMVKYNNVPS